MLGPYLHPRGRRAVATALARLGVTVLDGADALVTVVSQGHVELADGGRLESDLTVWAAGFGVPDLAAGSGLATDALGRLLTDETLTSVDDPRIVAAGDAVAPSGLPFRMSCQSAVQLGPQAAETVLARLEGRRPAPVAVGFAGQCISLGRTTGVFQFAHRNDVALPLLLGGRAGAGLKELICRGTVWQLGFEARHPDVFDVWLKDRKRRELLLAGPEAERAVL